MTFDWHMLYPLHTVILDNSHVFGGVLCKAQLCNFSKWFFSPRFGVVPIWELWQFCYVRIGPPKTQVLLQLCRPRGWAVTGMSIDYIKCFDLIRRAVVLALALELGMDPGTCRAPGAMYREPRRQVR